MRKEAIASLEQRIVADQLWQGSRAGQVALRRLSRLSEAVRRLEGLGSELEMWCELAELARVERDSSLEGEMAVEVGRWRELIEALEVNLLLNEPYDERDAYILLYPDLPPVGAIPCGCPGQHLAELLLRMYTGWAESKGFTVNLIEQVRGSWYGVRRAMLQVRGSYAYGYARTQRGLHQLIKRSPYAPTEELARGVARVEVMPEIELRSEMPIRLEEVRVEVYRAPRYACFASYPKLTVRLTHLPTNVVVTYEANKGSEAHCKEKALHLLRVRLLGRLLQQQADMIERDQEKPICTYMLSASGLVTDHRTGEQSEEVDAVLDGGIERFMAAYLRHYVPSR